LGPEFYRLLSFYHIYGLKSWNFSSKLVPFWNSPVRDFYSAVKNP
jgi:UV DNA damage repair endonuclease